MSQLQTVHSVLFVARLSEKLFGDYLSTGMAFREKPRLQQTRTGSGVTLYLFFHLWRHDFPEKA